MATPGSLAISSLHYTQVTKIVCIISNGYPGTRSKLIWVPGVRTALYHFSDTSSYQCDGLTLYYSVLDLGRGTRQTDQQTPAIIL